MSMVAQNFFAHLAAALSLPELRLNEDSVCCVHVPGELEIQMEWVAEGGRLMVLAPVGRLTGDPQHVRGLLAANFLFGGTRGETLALEPGGERVFLCRDIELAVLPVEQAIDRFEAFVETARQWQRTLAGAAADSGASLQAAPYMLKI